MYRIFSPLRIDPMVYFEGTDAEIEAAEAAETAAIEAVQAVITAPQFTAMQYSTPAGACRILHRSTRPGFKWQLSYIGTDGIPIMHESFGRIGELAEVEDVYPEQELYRHFVRQFCEAEPLEVEII